MNQPTPGYLSRLRQGITDAFSLEELRTLCSDLGVDYDNLGGEGKEAKARELVSFLNRRGELSLLVEYCLSKRPAYPWPEGEAEKGTAAGGHSDTAARHLRQQLTELQGRYETLSKRVAALDKDLGRTLDSETKLILEERRQELVAERAQVADDMARIEHQLGA
jgi:hypothetical protein